MPNAFVRKLRRFTPLGDEEVAALVRLVANPARHPRGTDLVREGERPEATQLLLRGWACRYKILSNGKRQIVGFLVPGDSCDVHVTLLDVMDHSIELLTDADVVAIPAGKSKRLMERFKRIETALWCSTLVDEAILREWLANMGQRDGHARVAHLLCELWFRLKAIGQVDEREEFDFPLTQEQIGDALGLTPVHVNRMLKRLKEERLIALEQRRLRLLDPPRLFAFCGFDPSYLHPGQGRPVAERRSDGAKR
jgi:CRP-like cAMP-binding protein